MADFCNNCAPNVWGEEIDPDIEVTRIALGLENGHFESVLCEGCGLRAVGKSDEGRPMVAILEEEGQVEDMVRWISMEEWLAGEVR